MVFPKRKDHGRGREVAAALAQRGVAGRATVVSMRETGWAREGAPREVEFTLALELSDAGPLHVVHRQVMTRWTGHGLAPGEPVRVLYDSENPQTLTIAGHERLRTDVRDGQIVALELHDLGSAPGS